MITDAKGAYQFQVIEQDGSVVFDTGEFDNIITIGALDYGSPFSSGSICIGVGETAPDFNDSDLVSQAAIASANFDTAGTLFSSDGKRYAKRKSTASFTGLNIEVSEVGYKRGSTLISRSLVRDGNGLVTKIPIEAHQTLKITYFVYILIQDLLATGTINTGYGSADFEIKPSPDLLAPMGIFAGRFDAPFDSTKMTALLSSGTMDSENLTVTYDSETRECTVIANWLAIDTNRTITGFQSKSNTDNVPIITLSNSLTMPANNDLTLELKFQWGTLV